MSPRVLLTIAWLFMAANWLPAAEMFKQINVSTKS